ncbi:sodium/calcium exchanger 1a isoform X2 [Astyanax mexicanus]|uniref:sodium/calcium exchanger 1a isoform X2 n=1 Tax=Astyanax mexicanus TaxID=7994 RepID=UPI0020CB2B13|nr:sodium/calcium exchanger 1a isoform X2 [Astyanax mexicanus]
MPAPASARASPLLSSAALHTHTHTHHCSPPSTETNNKMEYSIRKMSTSDTSSFLPSFRLKLVVLFIVFSHELHQADAGGSKVDEESSSANESGTCSGSYECKEGVILPLWTPENPSFPDKLARATIYFVGLFYMFLGVSIIADRFMASIEVITSQEKEITIKKPNGETTTTTVRIWNETVSNLTLMALGSSAPEILLSVVEVCGHNFDAGELGPNTIVGSAAFNMFVIIGLCVSVIPDGDHRKVKHLRVFFVTAAWSIFAYTWLYLILAVISPGVVEVWEGLLTLFFFPICVVFAWVADRRLLFYKYVNKRYRVGKQRGMIIETEGEPELQSKADIEMDGQMLNSHGEDFLDGAVNTDIKEMDEEEARREMARILKDLKQKHPEKEMEQLIELANYQVLSQQQKSRAFYRCQATRLMTGAGNILKKHAADQARKAICTHELRTEVSDNDFSSKIFFDPGTYQCLENCGSVALNVVRRGGDLTSTISVSYRTEDGTANAGSDYEFSEGVIVFNPGEAEKEIRIEIIDDDIFEEDEHFLVHLSNIQVLSESRNNGSPVLNHVDSLAGLGLPSTATVTIFDDDHAGIFAFEEQMMHVSESIGIMEVKVVRTSGARGAVVVPYKTIEGTAKGGGEDFEDTHGVLEFQNDEISKTLQINIIDDEEYEKNKNFFMELGEPRMMEMSERKAVLLHECGGFVKTDKQLFGRDVYRKVQGRDNPVPSTIINLADISLSQKEQEERRIAEMGRPTLGDNTRLEVVIEESYEFKSTVDKLIKKTNLALLVGTNSWREQFVEAITVNSGGDDDEECSEEKLPSCFDYVMHFLTVFWKILFAFVPPTDYWNGWACFVVSISMIGLLTAVIGDLASHFGCTVGLKDSVTAVVFVALGTSVPDTFASKVAAIQDQYADACIGNVTGSNAVNVFLGIGVAWSIAAIYHQWNGQYFRVQPGTLAFSVTLFTIFAFVCIAVLMYRRRPEIGGELGGPRTAKRITSSLFFSLWLLYIVLSSLEAYCIIKGF